MRAKKHISKGVFNNFNFKMGQFGNLEVPNPTNGQAWISWLELIQVCRPYTCKVFMGKFLIWWHGDKSLGVWILGLTWTVLYWLADFHVYLERGKTLGCISIYRIYRCNDLRLFGILWGFLCGRWLSYVGLFQFNGLWFVPIRLTQFVFFVFAQ